MKLRTRSRSMISLMIVACLLIVPVSVLAKKGKDHFREGLKYEEAQQWEKAAQEFTLAIAADPSNVDFKLHFQRAVFNASQMFMQQGRALAEQRDYVGAYNAFRQAYGYDPVNQLAVSEMERMIRLQEAKTGKVASSGGGDNSANDSSGARVQDPGTSSGRQEQVRVVNYTGDLKHYIRTLSEQLGLNVIFDRQSFAQPRTLDINLSQPTTTAKALDYIFLQENLFFQKLDRRTILVADQARRPQYQQLVVRTFYLSNAKPDKAKNVIGQALPASVGRPQSIVVLDEDTNSLTVRDTAENVQLIGELIRNIDKDRAEVVMDVNIYEVSRNNFLQFGNLWAAGNPFNVGGTPGLAVLTDGGVTNSKGTGVDLSSVVGASPTALAAALVIPASAFTAFQSKDNSKLIASTQVHAFNNEESTARIGQRVPVQTAQAYPFGVQTGTTNNPQTGFPSGGFPVINYEPTGLTLNFTPQVFPNLDVQVKMKIESKDVTGAKTLTPTFIERTITGTARVQNNRTMMLASVSTEVQANGRTGLPVLSGLPILGRFFSAPTNENRQVDIVITVTPRVLRAPAVTPRDEEMRPSGTLQSPTTGSLEAMLRDTEREEQLAAARRLPREVVLQLPDAPPPTYGPAPLPATNQTAAATTVAANTNGNGPSAPPLQFAPVPKNKETAPKGTETALTVAVNQTDTAMPQPKTAEARQQTDPPAPKSMDVASAVKTMLAPTTPVSTAELSAKQDPNLVLVAEKIAPKSDPETTPKLSALSGSVMELRLTSEKSEMQIGQKQQFAVEVKSNSTLGLAVIMLRFDPRVIKISNIAAGKLFADAKVAPTITQSTAQDGMVLISISPGAGSPLSGAGSLLTLDIEALAAGDSSLAFDMSNVHLVALDGRDVMLQIEPVNLTIKQ